MESAAIASFETVCSLLNNSINAKKNIQAEDFPTPTSMNLIQFIDLLQSLVSNLSLLQHHTLIYIIICYINSNSLITYIKYNFRVTNQMIMKIYSSPYYN
jgi:hypothetical protein